MRHLSKGRKFNRERGMRQAFIKSLAANIVLKGKIETTEARAKEARPVVERLVSIGKGQTTADFRILLAFLPKKAAEKVFYDLAPKYKERNGGYLRIMKSSKLRKGDASRMAIIEFV